MNAPVMLKLLLFKDLGISVIKYSNPFDIEHYSIGFAAITQEWVWFVALQSQCKQSRAEVSFTK